MVEIEWTEDVLGAVIRAWIERAGKFNACYAAYETEPHETALRLEAEAHATRAPPECLEAGYGWANVNGTCTGCNGTHDDSLVVHYERAVEVGEGFVAREILKRTHAWPGWRCVDIEFRSDEGRQGAITMRLYGGRRDGRSRESRIPRKYCEKEHMI